MADRPSKKLPTDYPQMAFRIKSEDKDALMNFINQIHDIANKSVEKNEKKVKKNEVIVDALWLGLIQLKKKYRHLDQEREQKALEESQKDQPLDSEAS